MATATIINLPPEIIHCIFDRCDIDTIFHSIRYVCKLFYHAVNSYKIHTLHFTEKSSYNFKHIFRLIPIESITSLTISNGWEKRGRLAKFISDVGSQKFNALQSLALHNVSCHELEQLLNNVSPQSLSSLSIDFRYTKSSDYDQRLTALSAALGRLNLQKLFIKESGRTMKSVSWPSNCNLRELRVDSLNYEDCLIILDRLPHLLKLVMNSLDKPYDDRQVVSTPTLKCQTILENLTVNRIQSGYKDLESLLLLTPRLRHLRLVDERVPLKIFFDGKHWETFITNSLPLLTNFNFCFSHTLLLDEVVPPLNEFIAAFQTLSWLDIKCWNVILQYTIPNYLQIYSQSMTPAKISNAFLLSSKDNTCTYVKSTYVDLVRD